MSTCYSPTTECIHSVFVEEITAAGGCVTDVYDDGDRLFLRSVAPRTDEVRRGDAIQAGLALRVVGPAIALHPYIFRQVCRNGAIMAVALDTRQIQRHEANPWALTPEWDEGITELREAIRAFSTDDALARGARNMQVAMRTEADMAITAMSVLAHVPSHMLRMIAQHVGGTLAQERDRSVFTVVNAITALARDARDPELRWQLEEVGGKILTRLEAQPALSMVANIC